MRGLQGIVIGAASLLLTVAAYPDDNSRAPAQTQEAPTPADADGPRIPQERLPAWLKLGVEIRGRLEAETGFKPSPGPDDTYYLHRLRLNVGIEPASWLRFYFQGQDARAAGYDHPVPASVADSMDLRLGYVEIGGTPEMPWTLRVGRQELRFGESRLIGSSNWSNVARSYDVLQLTYKTPGVHLDWFAAAVVPTVNGRFDRPALRNGVYGFYSSFDKLIRKAVVEPYVFWKTESVVRGELGGAGDQDVYAPGIRMVGHLPWRLDYNFEAVVETGHNAQDRIRAWAGHWLLGWTLPVAAWQPRLVSEYNYASGDGNPHDGRHCTFDPLYPTNHAKYGAADRVTWRNIHDLMGGIAVKPLKNWRYELDYHGFWLATRQDGLYSASGALVVIDPGATSSFVGSEIDLLAFYERSERLQIGFGYAHLFAGPYLRQSTKERGSTYPYVMWSYRL
jgi:hypothetical protein